MNICKCWCYCTVSVLIIVISGLQPFSQSCDELLRFKTKTNLHSSRFKFYLWLSLCLCVSRSVSVSLSVSLCRVDPVGHSVPGSLCPFQLLILGASADIFRLFSTFQRVFLKVYLLIVSSTEEVSVFHCFFYYSWSPQTESLDFTHICSVLFLNSVWWCTEDKLMKPTVGIQRK